MNQGFIEQEARAAGRRNRRLFLLLLFVYVCIMTVLVVVLKDAIDLADSRSRTLVVCFFIFSGLMLIFTVIGLIGSLRGRADGKILILPFEEDTKKAVGERIDREVREGNIQVFEYMEKFKEGEEPWGDRVMLLPSYLLLMNSMGKIIAIPREKIYWICAQAGIQGRSSYRVRLLVFTEKKIFDHMTAIDIGHVEELADKLYQYIPNVFCEYDTFSLSYELEKLFAKDHEKFLKFYEEEKRKHGNFIKS